MDMVMDNYNYADEIRELRKEREIMNRLIAELYTFMRVIDEDKFIVAIGVRKRIDASALKLREFRRNSGGI